MTDFQTRMLDYIEMFRNRKGFPPTRREIGGRFGKSTSIINLNLFQMQREGWVEVSPGKARGIRIVKRPVEVSSPTEVA